MKLARDLETLAAPAVGFDDGPAATVKWYQDNESWWRPLKDR